jgi:hypothetical protein
VKKIFISLFIFNFTFNVISIPTPQTLQQTKLHSVTSITPLEQAITPLRILDQQKATKAAQLIMREAESIYTKDENGRTPLNNATDNKNLLPLTFRFIQATQTCQIFEETYKGRRLANNPPPTAALMSYLKAQETMEHFLLNKIIINQ